MIFIDNEQEKIEPSEEFKEKLSEMIDFALKEEEVKVPYEISLLFVDNEGIHEINKEQRGIDKVTDVLSFPMLDYPNGKVFKDAYKGYEFKAEDLDGDLLVLGDIVLSLERAKEQSVEFGHSYMREACYLVIHSVLHLLGYDHMKDDEKILMRQREEYILDKFNINREL